MIRDPWLKALVIVMVMIASLYLVSMLWQALTQFGDVILLFFLAWVLAFILEPLVTAIYHTTPLPRAGAVAVTYLWLLLLLSAGVLLLVPVLSTQVSQAAKQVPDYAQAVGVQLGVLQASLAERGIYVDLTRTLDYPELVRRAEAIGSQMLSNALGIATGVATLLLQVTLIVILSFYITLDGERLSRAILAAVPRKMRRDAEHLFASVDLAFTGFLRGQVFQGLMNAAATAAIMAAVGMDLVLLVSLVGGLLMMIPFIGPVLALLLPVALAYFTKAGVFWLVLGLMLIQQQVVVNVISPRLVGSMVGLHPLLVFFAVLAGMKLAGAWGVVFGIPIMAVMVAMISFYRRAIEASPAEDTKAKPTPDGQQASTGEAKLRSEGGATIP